MKMTLQYVILTFFVATAVLGGSPVADTLSQTPAASLNGDHDNAAPQRNLSEALKVEIDPSAHLSKLVDDSPITTVAPNKTTSTTTPAPAPPSPPKTSTVPPSTTTTAHPNSTTTTPAPSTTTTTTMKPHTTTTSTSTPPTTTTAHPNSTTTSTTPAPSSTTTTTMKPNTTTTTTVPPPPSTTHAPSKPDRHFDGASFIGGIVLSVIMTCIGFVAWKYYQARYGRNYHTL